MPARPDPTAESDLTHRPAGESDLTHRMGGSDRFRAGDAAPEHVISVLADRQHGVVSRSQLIARGLSERMIDRRIERGWLHIVHPGAYAVGRRGLSREGRWMAAVLAGGRGAVLSHRSAAELWRLLPPLAGPADVTIRRWRRRTRNIIWHCSVLPSDEVTSLGPIPVTTVARTLLDLAAVAKPHVLEEAMREAEHRRLADSPSLADLLERYPGRRGAGRVKAVLATGVADLGVTREELERRFLRFLDRYRLPRPRLNYPIQLPGRLVIADCAWPERRLIAELDGRAFHDNARAFESDRARDRALLVAGWRTVRITWRQLHDAPALLAGELAALLA